MSRYPAVTVASLKNHVYVSAMQKAPDAYEQLSRLAERKNRLVRAKMLIDEEIAELERLMARTHHGSRSRVLSRELFEQVVLPELKRLHTGFTPHQIFRLLSSRGYPTTASAVRKFLLSLRDDLLRHDASRSLWFAREPEHGEVPHTK